VRQLAAVEGEIARLQERRADLAALIMRERAEDYVARQTRKDRPMLKQAVMILVALGLMVGVAEAQTYPLGQALTAQWEGATNEADAAVDHYEIRVDTGAWTPTGQTVPQATYTYAIPQALLTIGTHTVEVRACAGAVCGSSTAPVSVTIARPLPGLPRNPRVVPTPSVATLTIPQAIEKANAYATLILDRPLTAQELNILALRHPPVPPTRETVIALLDATFAEFVVQP